MLEHPTKLLSLIDEYKRLVELRGYTPQTRGQRFNSFIAELLQCWGIKAAPNIRGSGEIDVAFEWNGRHFTLEAKWEKEPTSTDPIAKLQKRLRQRLAGTIGLLLSMSDFTPDAIRDLKEGEQLSVLLLTREHLEAMLSGFLAPEEVIGTIVRRASNYGEGFVHFQQLFDNVNVAQLEVTFGSPDEWKNQELIVDSVSSFQTTTLASNFSTSQSGVAEFTKGKLLLTLEQGIYLFDTRKLSLSVFLGIPNCTRNVLVAQDGTTYIVRGRGIARIKNGEFAIVAGGFIGNVCLFPGYGTDVWVFSNGYPGDQDWARPQVTLLGVALGDEQRTTINYSPACGINAAFISEGRFLVVGSFGLAVVEIGAQTQLLRREQHMGLIRLSADRFLLSSGGIDLSELELSTNSVKPIAKLRLQGVVSELARSYDGGGYLFAHYPKGNGQTGGAVIRWRY
jgi:hypothetical protein